MLELVSIRKSFASKSGRVCALDEVSLSIRAGQFIAIRGPSGCGKSTLLLAAGGLLRPDEGRVLVDGNDVYAMSPERRARLRAEAIGFVFQRFHLVPYLSVLDNVLSPGLALPMNDVRRRGMDLVERFGLADRMHHFPAQLSTGERQRVALARAMLNGPRLILADEPTGNLDPDNARVVLQSLTAFVGGGGAVLLVTHDPAAAGVAQTTITMQRGKTTSTACDSRAIP